MSDLIPVDEIVPCLRKRRTILRLAAADEIERLHAHIDVLHDLMIANNISAPAQPPTDRKEA